MKRTIYKLSFLFLFVLSLSTLYGQKTNVNTLVVNASLGEHTISKHIYGHFAEHLGRCIYGGIYVGTDSDIPNIRGIRLDVLNALKEIKVPVLRWPGGCFADTYHWKDGIGPREDRPSMVNIHWGNVTEDNSFGTHEFMDLCELLECEPYICGNIGSGTVQEMAEWIEYLTSPAESPMTKLRKKNGREEPWQVKFWGLGNEAWGCGGRMDVHYYVNVGANYSAFCRSYPGNRIYKIACGGYGWRDNYEWTEILMKEGRSRIGFQAQAIHYYTSDGQKKTRYKATEFEEDGWFDVLQGTLRMEEILKQNVAIMDRYDPENKVDLIIDEWGTWHYVEEGTNPRFLYQQNSLRDAVVAALNLNIFNNFCERLYMANIAQTVNVLQAMILTKDDQIVRTPTFYVYKMFVPHQEANMLPVQLKCRDYEYKDEKIPSMNASASIDAEGKIHLSIVNSDPQREQDIQCMIYGKKIASVQGQILTGSKINAFNDFGQPEEVTIKNFNGATLKKDQLNIHIPAKSIVMLAVE